MRLTLFDTHMRLRRPRLSWGTFQVRKCCQSPDASTVVCTSYSRYRQDFQLRIFFRCDQYHQTETCPTIGATSHQSHQSHWCQYWTPPYCDSPPGHSLGFVGHRRSCRCDFLLTPRQNVVWIQAFPTIGSIRGKYVREIGGNLRSIQVEDVDFEVVMCLRGSTGSHKGDHIKGLRSKGSVPLYRFRVRHWLKNLK